MRLKMRLLFHVQAEWEITTGGYEMIPIFYFIFFSNLYSWMRTLSVRVASLVFMWWWLRFRLKSSGLLYDPFSQRTWQFYKSKGHTVVVGEVIISLKMKPMETCVIIDKEGPEWVLTFHILNHWHIKGLEKCFPTKRRLWKEQLLKQQMHSLSITTSLIPSVWQHFQSPEEQRDETRLEKESLGEAKPRSRQHRF